MLVDVGLGQPLGSSRQPRLDHQLFEFADIDLGQAHEDRRIPIEVGGGEVDGGIVGEQRLLRAEVLDSGSEDVAGRCVVTKGAKIRGAKRALPDEQLVADSP